MRVGCTNDFAQEKKRGASEIVFFQDRIERYVLSVVAEFAIRNVENHAIHDLSPIGAMRKENKFRLVVDEVTDQPRAGDAVDFDSFASDPCHGSHDLIEMEGRQSIHLVGKNVVTLRAYRLATQANRVYTGAVRATWKRIRYRFEWLAL